MRTDTLSETPDHTVVAAATATGPAALAVVQLAGPDAAAILARRIRLRRLPMRGQVRRTTLTDRNGRPRDEVIVACLADSPPLYEITCHGGVRILQRVVEIFVTEGARRTEPARLMEQVYGLTNPVAADAYRLLPAARTTLAARFLLHQATTGLADLMVKAERSCAGRGELEAALQYWPAVKYLLAGFTVVIVGPANAGKSTLLNALAAREHALVADLPGTTRDYVQADVQIRGVPVTLIDTAGLGATGDALAAQAREKTLSASESADAAIVVLDAANPLRLPAQWAQAADELDPIRQLLDRGRIGAVLNKIDHPHRCHALAGWGEAAPMVEVSALTGANLGDVESIILRLTGLDGFDWRRPTAFTEDQAQALRRRP